MFWGRELDKALAFWRDFEDLRAFFIQYRKDVTEFTPEMKVTHAIEQVLTEAETISDTLIEFSRLDNLKELFKPLDNREEGEPGYELQKTKQNPECEKECFSSMQ